MNLTELIRRLAIEVSPLWKWAQRNWQIILIGFIASFLLLKYWRKWKA